MHNIANNHIDIVTFASPTAIKGWVYNGGRVDIPISVIGMTTYNYAQHVGFKDIIYRKEHEHKPNTNSNSKPNSNSNTKPRDSIVSQVVRWLYTSSSSTTANPTTKPVTATEPNTIPNDSCVPLKLKDGIIQKWSRSILNHVDKYH